MALIIAILPMLTLLAAIAIQAPDWETRHYARISLATGLALALVL